MNKECGACGREIPEGGAIHCGSDHEPLNVCSGCGHEVDPDWCHCGDAISDHNGMSHNHSPVPMGCQCGRESGESQETVAELVAALRGLMPEGWDDPDGHMDHMPGIKVARLLLARYALPQA